jgi:hypothetical protein
MSAGPHPVARIGRAALALAVALFAVAGCGDSATSMDDGNGGSNGNGNPSGPLTDAQVFEDAAFTNTWSWWANSPALLDRAGDSPHAEQIRTRYNIQAAMQLTPEGRVMEPAEFPDRSIIVKEVYTDGDLTGLLVMYKAEDDPNAGHGSWLWAEFDPEGNVRHSIAQDNAACHDCHNQTLLFDHTRMNDSH